MIQVQGLVLLVGSLFIPSAALINCLLIPSNANAGLFGTIDSVDVLKEVAANQRPGKEKRAIASDRDESGTTETEAPAPRTAHPKASDGGISD